LIIVNSKDFILAITKNSISTLVFSLGKNKNYINLYKATAKRAKNTLLIPMSFIYALPIKYNFSFK